MDLKTLYTQLILEESRNPEHRYEINCPTFEGDGTNPSCGDHLHVQLRLNEAGEELIEEVAFTGEGCAISQASASMMAQLLEGRSIEEGKRLLSDFITLIREGEVSEDAAEALEDAMAFQDIANMPARVKCAVLAWHTALNLLGGEDDPADDFLD